MHCFPLHPSVWDFTNGSTGLILPRAFLVRIKSFIVVSQNEPQLAHLIRRSNYASMRFFGCQKINDSRFLPQYYCFPPLIRSYLRSKSHLPVHVLPQSRFPYDK
jgi:hypothetical protein